MTTPQPHCFDGAYRGLRVLVTGHTGFKGGWLSEWLLRLGAEVSGFSLDVPTEPSLFEASGLATRLAHDFRGDLRDYAALARAFATTRPDVVFHLAAQPIVSTSYADPLSTFTTNAIGTANVLECLRATPDVRAAVIITSDKAYENVEWEFGYRESDRLGGHDPYSASKACAEVVFSSYYRSFLRKKEARVASARAGNVIGGGDWALDRIVPDTIRSWLRNERALLRNPRATRPWQHVLEPLSGYLALGSSLLRGEPEVAGESFNFGPDATVIQSVEELTAELARHWPEASYEALKTEGLGIHEAGLLKLCCDKALRRLRWSALLAFPETAAFTADWYRRVADGKEPAAAVTAEQLARFETLARERKKLWAVPS